MVTHKRCTTCGRRKPADPAHFYREAGRLKAECIVCAREASRYYRMIPSVQARRRERDRARYRRQHPDSQPLRCTLCSLWGHNRRTCPIRLAANSLPERAVARA